MDYAFFMHKALEEAREALGLGEFPVGCVLVHEGRIVATGAREHSRSGRRNELDHAEMVALRRLVDLPNVQRDRVTVFSTLEPCLMCYAAILLNGIKKIVYAYEDVMGGGTNVDLTLLNPYYGQAGVTIVPHVMRDESLKLLKAFFSHPKNDYLKGTLLAEYTLKA